MFGEYILTSVTTFANQIFLSGGLFLLLSDSEFIKFVMQMSSRMLEEQQEEKKVGGIQSEHTSRWWWKYPSLLKTCKGSTKPL